MRNWLASGSGIGAPPRNAGRRQTRRAVTLARLPACPPAANPQVSSMTTPPAANRTRSEPVAVARMVQALQPSHRDVGRALTTHFSRRRRHYLHAAPPKAVQTLRGPSASLLGRRQSAPKPCGPAVTALRTPLTDASSGSSHAGSPSRVSGGSGRPRPTCSARRRSGRDRMAVERCTQARRGVTAPVPLAQVTVLRGAPHCTFPFPMSELPSGNRLCSLPHRPGSHCAPLRSEPGERGGGGPTGCCDRT